MLVCFCWVYEAWEAEGSLSAVSTLPASRLPIPFGDQEPRRNRKYCTGVAGSPDVNFRPSVREDLRWYPNMSYTPPSFPHLHITVHSTFPTVLLCSSLSLSLFLFCRHDQQQKQCAKDCTLTYDGSLTKCNQEVSDQTKNTYGANLDACANIASGIMDDCMVSLAPSLSVYRCSFVGGVRMHACARVRRG